MAQKLISEIARKNKLLVTDLVAFAKAHGEKYDYWEWNGKHTIESPRGFIQHFWRYKCTLEQNKAEEICAQFLIEKERVKLLCNQNVTIDGFSKITDTWKSDEIIKLMKNNGYERKFKENPDVFWYIKK